MCGIYGFIGQPTKETKGIMTELGILNEIRGRDSTGLAFVTPHTMYYYKNAVDATRFFTQDDTVKKHLATFTKQSVLTILGHTRFATHGEITSVNAHPFTTEHFVFTHNGVIVNYEELNRFYKTTHEVDSRVIGEVLEEAENTIAAFEKLSGYFTIPYVHLPERDALHVAVSHGDFSFAYKGGQLYYSSDITHLREALRNKQGWQLCRGGNNVRYRFSFSDNTLVIGKEKLQTKSYEKYFSGFGYAEDDDPWQRYYAAEKQYGIMHADSTHASDTRFQETVRCQNGRDCPNRGEKWHIDNDFFLPEKTDEPLTRKYLQQKRHPSSPLKKSLAKLAKYGKDEVHSIFKSTNPHVTFD